MKEVIVALFEQALDQLVDAGIIDSAARRPVQIEKTRDPNHGDLATNVALIHAKAARMSPQQLASQLITKIPNSRAIAATEIADPGFINIWISKEVSFASIAFCLTKFETFGSCAQTNKKVQVEYVSANPTGPLHVGHGRGAAYGATLVNLLRARGHNVESEYYVNDAGRQMDILALSVFLRYLESCGNTLIFPLAAYQGDYIQSIGRQLHRMYGDILDIDCLQLSVGAPADTEDTKDAYIDAIISAAKTILGANWEKPFNISLNAILADIRNDLSKFGVHFNQWFSERSLVTSGEIDKTIATLQSKGFLFSQHGTLWFKSTQFGDDKDRVVRRENGTTTYFASDIAYIANKFARGFDQIIYIWGADHHGYVTRLRAATKALGYDPDRVVIRLVQFANLYKDGVRLQMSTRSGSFVSLRELRDEIGRDACRYFYILRKTDQHLDFDLSLATSRSKDNPMYYVQYAHARICRVFEGLKEEKFDQSRGISQLAKLDRQDELDLASTIGCFPEVVEKAADSLETHLLCYYLQDLASEFHRWYNGTRLLVDDPNIRDARLCLAKATQITLQKGLSLIGVGAPESM